MTLSTKIFRVAAVALAMATGAALISEPAQAFGRGGGGHGGGFHGGGFHGGGFRGGGWRGGYGGWRGGYGGWGGGWGYGGLGWGVPYYGGYYDDDYYDDAPVCSVRHVRVHTPRGWRWRNVRYCTR